MEHTWDIRAMMIMKILFFIVLLFPQMTIGQNASGSFSDFYSDELIKQYGENSKIDSSQLENLISAVQRLGQANGGMQASHGNPGLSLVNATSGDYLGNCSSFTDITCLKSECLDAATILRLYGLLPTEGATVSELTQVSPSVLFQLQNPKCYKNIETGPKKKQKPTATEVWGYGFLAVTIINIAACLGILFYPVMKTTIYRRLLMCMVGLAVGTLSASAILVLIPEAFQLMDDESHVKDIYIWRALVVIGGIYLFFTIERILDAILLRHKRRKLKSVQGIDNSYTNTAFDGDRDLAVVETDLKASNGHGHSHGAPLDMESNKKPLKWAPLGSIKSVAWMVIVGDALHNFVDGLGIGAAFSENTLTGISLSLAILCEELPHELGDFAILLASGMGICQALLMNLLSALTCYIGLIVGIQLGALEQGALWIFPVAGGMFLYISLVDMLPEMNDQARQEEERGGNKCMVYFLQNLGLLLGWAIILFLSLYGDNIEIG